MRPDAASEDEAVALVLLCYHAAGDQHLSYRTPQSGQLLCRMGSELMWGRTAAMGAPSHRPPSTLDSCSKWRACPCRCATPMHMPAHAVTALTLRGMRQHPPAPPAMSLTPAWTTAALQGTAPARSMPHTREPIASCCCIKTCSAWVSVQSPVILLWKHAVCLSV